MNEAVFDTEAQAQARQALDLICHLEVYKDEPYKSQTTAWAIPRQRLDGKWCYPCCPHADYTGITVEEYNPENYPQEAQNA